MLTRGDELFTLCEILVKPMQMGDTKEVAYYQKLLTTTAAVLPFEEKAAITNDTRLHSKQIPGIQFIVSLDRVPL